MRRVFDITAVILLVTLSTIFMVIALLFPARGVRLAAKHIAQALGNAATRISTPQVPPHHHPR
ncbi:hypothetical protein Ait01nite_068140 [Actinoplanes italicus]|uniref:Uncharacterized protein n=1 Tax=Actinoplanes italicus TaxID=113567 RepID=A0A2T0K1T3_9ACTN|nr:hypothetical protein [Actinoplanes italicus]PRX16562.1 hypothetical protein CLV67_119143 [Actinoplanes italicus]GIE33769.1 hypothetical protein Ait01nite_068140 [Actinoplanes italicus]